MKLAKLLGAGKSFFGGHSGAPYRESKRVYLPKFNDAAKNPFVSKPKETAPVESRPAPAAVVATPAVATKVPVEIPQVPGAKPAKPGWADKLNPFRSPQPAPPPPPVATMQPELSLDAVKVLHNDLSDADVEVVPVKSRPAAPAAKAASPADFMSEPVLRTI